MKVILNNQRVQDIFHEHVLIQKHLTAQELHQNCSVSKLHLCSLLFILWLMERRRTSHIWVLLTILYLWQTGKPGVSVSLSCPGRFHRLLLIPMPPCCSIWISNAAEEIASKILKSCFHWLSLRFVTTFLFRSGCTALNFAKFKFKVRATSWYPLSG